MKFSFYGSLGWMSFSPTNQNETVQQEWQKRWASSLKLHENQLILKCCLFPNSSCLSAKVQKKRLIQLLHWLQHVISIYLLVAAFGKLKSSENSHYSSAELKTTPQNNICLLCGGAWIKHSEFQLWLESESGSKGSSIRRDNLQEFNMIY